MHGCIFYNVYVPWGTYLLFSLHYFGVEATPSWFSQKVKYACTLESCKYGINCEELDKDSRWKEWTAKKIKCRGIGRFWYQSRQNTEGGAQSSLLAPVPMLIVEWKSGRAILEIKLGFIQRATMFYPVRWQKILSGTRTDSKNDSKCSLLFVVGCQHSNTLMH